MKNDKEIQGENSCNINKFNNQQNATLTPPCINESKQLNNSSNMSTQTLFTPFTTKMIFNKIETNQKIKKNFLDFSNSEINQKNGYSYRGMSYETIGVSSKRGKKKKSKSVLTDEELKGISNLNKELTKSNSHINICNFKAKPQSLDTIKNREKISIRNKKLSIKNEINLPKITYRVDNLKVPDIWKSDVKIKEKVQSNYIKTLLMNSNNNSGQNSLREESNEESKSYKNINSESSNNSSESNENLDKITIEVINKFNASKTNFLERHSNMFDEVKYHQGISEETIKQSEINNNINKKIAPANFNTNKYAKYNNKEVEKIKKELGNIRQSQFGHKFDFLNALHKKVQKTYFKKNNDYQTLKNVYSQFKQKRILDNRDSAISSQLYVMNQNPLFQINNMISFPSIVRDPTVLANLYDINMYKLESLAKKYKKI